MNKKIMILLFFTILILNSIFALDCQYTESVFDHTEIKAVPYSIDDDDPIELITYIIAGTIKAPIYFFNENDFNVDIEFDLIYYAPGGYSGNLGKKSSHIIKTIIPGTNEMPFGYSNGYYNSILNLIYRENDFVYLKNKEERIYKTICTICGDTNCLNDGLVCSINSECGSGNCILGKCSSDTNCYNNDCNCASNQIQYNNQKCIDKGSVTIGGKSITGNPEECVTKYISSVTGNCAVSLGDPCTKNLDCAENYCVMGVCSTSSTYCYNNNCKCKTNEIQFQNKACVLMNSVDDGEKTITGNKLECISSTIDIDTNICKSDCNNNQISYNYSCVNKKTVINGVVPQTSNREECKSEYINPKTGKCSMTSGDIFLRVIIVFLMLLIAGGALYYLLIKETTKIKIKDRETDQLRISEDKEIEKLRLSKDKEIEKLKLIKDKEIEQLDKKISVLDKEIFKSGKDLEKTKEEYKIEKSNKEKTEKIIENINKELDDKVKSKSLLLYKLKEVDGIKNKTESEIKNLAILKNQKEKLISEIDNKKSILAEKKKEKLKIELQLDEKDKEIETKQKIQAQNRILKEKEIERKQKEIIEKERIIKDAEQKLEQKEQFLKARKEESDRSYPNQQGWIVKQNRFGYECLVDSSHELFHLKWYRRNKGPIKPGNVIHHIDGNKLNNDINNLIQITESQHKMINHNNIRPGNREDGLKELKKKGII